MIFTQIEIEAPPTKVREIVLDFARIPKWHSGLYKSITPLAESGDILSPGNKVRIESEDATFDATITRNDESTIEWQSPPLYGLISGLHTFRFEPSKTTPGSTTLVTEEEFSGPAYLLMAQWLLGGKIKKQFEKFNADIKTEVEGA